ncbi:MAG: hypothetical protein A2019_04420 [Sulfurimonas sp. GWF2_37_8]|nr:MAG: hypothetical protein A2019_04420 [Sulfurimonas sp. GWF2_37_8]
MKFVRVRLDEDEYNKVQILANSSNKSIREYITSNALKTKNQTHLFYLLNSINGTLENINNEINRSGYRSFDIAIFNYLYLIEKLLMEVLSDNYGK